MSCWKLSDIHIHHLVDNDLSLNLVVVSSNEYLYIVHALEILHSLNIFFLIG